MISNYTESSKIAYNGVRDGGRRVIDLTKVMTFSEAAEKWGFANGNTIRKAVERKRFKEDEIRKSGDVWLTTYEAMQRVFGNPRKAEGILAYDELSQLIPQAVYQGKDIMPRLQEIFAIFEEAMHKKTAVTIIASAKQPQQILHVLQTRKELERALNLLKQYVNSLPLDSSSINKQR